MIQKQILINLFCKQNVYFVLVFNLSAGANAALAADVPFARRNAASYMNKYIAIVDMMTPSDLSLSSTDLYFFKK